MYVELGIPLNFLADSCAIFIRYIEQFNLRMQDNKIHSKYYIYTRDFAYFSFIENNDRLTDGASSNFARHSFMNVNED